MVSKTLSAFALEGHGHSMILYICKKIRRLENEGMQLIYMELLISMHSEMILIVKAKYGNVSDQMMK